MRATHTRGTFCLHATRCSALSPSSPARVPAESNGGKDREEIGADRTREGETVLQRCQRHPGCPRSAQYRFFRDGMANACRRVGTSPEGHSPAAHFDDSGTGACSNGRRLTRAEGSCDALATALHRGTAGARKDKARMRSGVPAHPLQPCFQGCGVARFNTCSGLKRPPPNGRGEPWHWCVLSRAASCSLKRCAAALGARRASCSAGDIATARSDVPGRCSGGSHA